MAPFLILLVIGFIGCQDTSSVAPVEGTVKLDGQALPRGMVQFVPINSKSGELATSTGSIDENGKYVLTTGKRTGALVGTHAVRIEARAIPKDEYDTLPASLIPERYNSETTSKLEVTVEPGKTNIIDLELTSK